MITKIKESVSLGEDIFFKEFDYMKYLADETLVTEAVLQCLKERDFVGAIELIEIHVKAVRKKPVL